MSAGEYRHHKNIILEQLSKFSKFSSIIFFNFVEFRYEFYKTKNRKEV